MSLKNSWLKGVVADVHPSVIFGKNTFVWSFVIVCEGTIIGDNCVVGSATFIGKNCKIGNGVRIQDKVFLVDNIVIEDNVFIGPGVTTTDDRYPVVNNTNYKREPPYFEMGCSIGAGAIILPGIRIGRYAIVGAGALVTKDVSPKTTVIGLPAKSRK